MMSRSRVRFGLAGGLLSVCFLLAPGAGRLHAQQFAPDSAPLGAQAATGPAVVYLFGGGTIRGTLLADNGPNGVRIRSQKSGAVFVIPAVKIDSVVRGPYSKASESESPVVPAPTPAAAPAQPALISGAAVALTLKAAPGSRAAAATSSQSVAATGRQRRIGGRRPAALDFHCIGGRRVHSAGRGGTSGRHTGGQVRALRPTARCRRAGRSCLGTGHIGVHPGGIGAVDTQGGS